MAVHPNYFISGVWKNDRGIITDVFLHLNTENGFKGGKKSTEASVIALLKANQTISTIRWDYSSAKWKRGASVIIVREGNTEFLRTQKDATVIDNLDNMIKMNGYLNDL
jgi:hypothetical protein